MIGRAGRRTAGALVAVLMLGAALVAVPPVGSPAAAVDTTSARERQRVDAVATPDLDWFACELGPRVRCATVRLPRDYDDPTGPTVELALAKVPALDRRHRLGTLFVNPGGPGESAVDFVSVASTFVGYDVAERFDLVGFDPRGVGYSDNVRCFAGPREQAAAAEVLPDVAFPFTTRQDRAWLRGQKAFSRACSTTGRPLTGAMSTAQAARDLDVLRRAVGDDRLSYLGFSYGTYLGEVYAALFPERIRAMALDGVIDPVAWAGTAATRNTPPMERLRAAQAGRRALLRILRECDRVGGRLCSFATGDPVEMFDRITRRLKKAPLTIDDEQTGERVTFGYSELVAYTYDALYDPFGYAYIADTLSSLAVLTEPPSGGRQSARTRAAARRDLLASLAKVPGSRRSGLLATGVSIGFPYANRADAYYGVLCTDTRNPAGARSWLTRVKAADAAVPYYGRMLSAQSLPCATNTWTVRDEDAYRGPFDTETSAPLLVVGNRWDPVTRIENAERTARLFPRARLLRSRSWGHTAYGSSDCLNSAVDSYLLRLRLPEAGTVCVGDVQPFVADGEEDEAENTEGVTALVTASRALERRGDRDFAGR